MRKIIAITQVTLDGVMHAPGGPEEDPSNGFTDAKHAQRCPRQHVPSGRSSSEGVKSAGNAPGTHN